jgi:hypothetical protein
MLPHDTSFPTITGSFSGGCHEAGNHWPILRGVRFCAYAQGRHVDELLGHSALPAEDSQTRRVFSELIWTLQVGLGYVLQISNVS